MKRFPLSPFSVLLILTGFLFTSAAIAQDKENEASSSESEKSEFEKLIDEATHYEGFLDLYQKEDHLYLALPKEKLGQDFLVSYRIAQGIGASFLFGGTMLNIFEASIVALEQHGNNVYLVHKPHRYVANENSPESKAVDLTFGSSVLASAKVEATNEEDVVLIDIYKWMVSDLSDVGSRVRLAVSSNPGQPGRATFDASLSYLESVKAFPQNVNLRAKLTFKPAEPVSLRTVPDSRYIPVSIHYVFSALPEEPMTPRMADDRVGFFMTVHKDFSNEEKTFFKRYVNKWRLECEGAPDSEGLCTPKESITYYIDHTVPEAYRQPMMDGVMAFNSAFENAGFRDAVRAELLPEDAEAEDIRYATLRWNTSDQAGYGAIGPSIVDPRTGEILDADILFEANMVLRFKNEWRSIVDPTAALEQMFEASSAELEALARGGEMSMLGSEIASQGALLRTLLAARGEIGPNDPVPQAYVHEAVKWVTMHEVGHTMGLRHNFRSSVDTPLDKLHDKNWAQEHGVFSSVMEYPTPNVAANGEANGNFYNPGMGSYDKWAIAYGYTPSAERAAELARQAAQPGHAYGTDEDARGSGAIDPTVNVYDLGADPLVWGKERAGLILDLLQTLPEHVLADNTPYYEVVNAYQSLLSQYARAVSTGVKYIGGQYQYRDHVGDPSARAPFVAVPKARQEEALDFLMTSAFSTTSFELSQEVLQKMGADRWSHWGNTNTHNGRIDYPLHEVVLGIQRTLLNSITDPQVFSRIRDAEMKFGANVVLTIPELMEQLTHGIWSEVWQAPGTNISSMRRDLQRAFLDRMNTLVTNAPNGMPADARSVTRMQLQDLLGRIDKRLTPPYNFDTYTLAHLRETQVRITKTLEAGLRLSN